MKKLSSALSGALLPLLLACAAEPAPRAGPPSAPASAPLIEPTPKAEEWIKPGADEARRREDIAQCYAYAEGVVEQNRQIESDRTTALYDNDPTNQTLIFRRQMRQYEFRNLLRDSYAACMRSKGYREP